MRPRLRPLAVLAAGILGACRTPEPAPGAADARARATPEARTSALLAEAGLSADLAADPELLRSDGGRGAEDVRASLEAYRGGDALKAVLLAQAAVGADPGNASRRRLLRALARDSAIDPDPDGLLPYRALVQHELRRADAAFYDSRFGAAVQACRRALLLDPDNAEAWTRLGSAHFALGESSQARSAYRRARALSPDDEALRAFLQERGWD